MTLKNLFLILAVIAITAAFSGCGRKNGNEIEKLGNSEIEGKNRNATSTDNTATTTDENAEDTATSTDELNTSDWKTYRNEEYGFELRYPKEWDFQGDQLNSFSTPFNKDGIPGTNLECGIFENTLLQSPKNWVNEKDFFQLNQFEDPDIYVAYGISKEIETLKINKGIELLNYKGGASGGGTFETAIVPANDKIIVVTYSLTLDYLGDINEQKIYASKVFKRILKSFQFLN